MEGSEAVGVDSRSGQGDPVGTRKWEVFSVSFEGGSGDRIPYPSIEWPLNTEGM